MADYPDWVLKHKKKGTYINKVGDKYYLYAAHSERVKGTNKVRRISDGYLGRITEADGLIPSKSQTPKITSKPCSYELGLAYTILYLTEDILSGLKISFPKNGSLIYVCSVLMYIYGFYSHELFVNSYLHFRFDSIIIPSEFTASQSTGIERGTRMICDKLNSIFEGDITLVKAYFFNVSLVEVQNCFYCCGITETVLSLSDKYDILWEDSLWLK